MDADASGVSVVPVEPGVYSIIDGDGRSYEARVEGGTVHVDGRTFEVEIVDPRAPVEALSRAGVDGQQPLKAGMPGRIVRVLAAPGDAVEAGQGVVVVEAMKMQNEVKSPKSGTVVSVAVQEGAAVSAGQVLAVVA